jgi:PPOX class probable F420-dependent enzyme
MDVEQARARLGEARVGRLATAGAAADVVIPRLVPCCFVLDGEQIWTVVDDVKPKTTTSLQRLADVRANPWAALLVDHYDDADWSRLWWVRADGPAAVVEDGADHARAVERLRAKYPQYDAHPPAGPAVRIDVERWRAWP